MQKENKYLYLKYFSLFCILISIIIAVFGIFLDKTIVGISLIGILSFVLNIICLICGLICIKKEKNTLTKILIAFSLLFILFNGIFIIGDLNDRRYNYVETEKFLTDYVKYVEDELEDEIVLKENIKKINSDFAEENIISIEEFNNISKTELSSIKQLKENGYNCDGYVIIKLKDSVDTNKYLATLNNEEFYDFESMGVYFDVNAYISCSGKYSYITAGFNEDIINNKEEIFSIIVPESYFSFTNTQIEENIESLKGLGDEYITSVKKENNTMVMEVTESQKNKLIERNNKYIETLSTDFSNANEKYHYKFNTDFSELTYYFDENISPITQGKIGAITASYILNNILKTNNQDWQVNLKIINCHTNKVVAEGTLPKDTIKYGELEWNNSY